MCRAKERKNKEKRKTKERKNQIALASHTTHTLTKDARSASNSEEESATKCS